MKGSEYKKECAKELRKWKKFSKDLSKLVQGFVKMTEAAKIFKDGK
jgi:hypothetical protein